MLTKKENPENREPVVALINGEVTLKKYYKLKPANPSFKPIYLKEEEIKIQGVVTGIIRKY